MLGSDLENLDDETKVILLSISIVYYYDDLEGDGATDDDNYEDDKGEKREKTQGLFASIPASRHG